MPALIAALLVFLSSAAVLVLEILAARLLAPYVGVTLEVYTAIIGVVLAGIAVGSWWGGKLADRIDPRHLIGPFLIAGGVLSYLTIPLVDGLGGGLRGATASTTVVLTFLAFFAPAAALTAVTPAIIKLQLASLDETGSVVGRLSAIGTAGAIIGTFLTGFVLVAAWPTRPVIRVVGTLLILLGITVTVWLRGRRAVTVGTVAAGLVAGGMSFAAAHPCDHESAYYCAAVEVDPNRPTGRALWLDTLRHSYVDLEDPTYLEFAYMQLFGDVLAAFAPPDEPLDVLHIGGGGFTMPRYLEATRPGSTSVALEVDPLLIDIAEQKLDLLDSDRFEILTGDARLSIQTLPQQAFDVVLGDAFGGVAIPWHLTTQEFLGTIRDRLRPEGIYAVNVIDYGPRDFLRAQLATTRAVFAHVALIGPADRMGPREQSAGGNVVILASDAPLPLDAILEANRLRAGQDVILSGADLDRFIGDARVLTDDYAPVDQLLTPLPTR